jgi:hypothetical protein
MATNNAPGRSSRLLSCTAFTPVREDGGGNSHLPAHISVSFCHEKKLSLIECSPQETGKMQPRRLMRQAKQKQRTNCKNTPRSDLLQRSLDVKGKVGFSEGEER